MKHITLIGDVHGQIDKYLKITDENEYTVQLGDMGFDYHLLQNEPSAKLHVWIHGNHDNITALKNKPPAGYLGRFGTHELNGIKFFFISGGYSIDNGDRRVWKIQKNEHSWWHDEELHYEEMEKCKELYLQEKPDILLTHSPSRNIINKMVNTKLIEYYGFSPDFYCQTSIFYNHLLEQHLPKVHIFGHMHKDFVTYECHPDTKKVCFFKCVKTLKTCRLYEDLSIL